jgi:predicted phage terminase large subunit-like protein
MVRTVEPNSIPEVLAQATPAELEALEHALFQEVAALSPADFATVVHPDYFQCPPHVQLISDKITQLVDGRLLKDDGTPYKRLLITMPPRHGKSELTSKYTPAWFVNRNPKNRVILASYEANFAAEWGGKVRDLLQEANSIGLECHLNPTTKARDSWRTQAGGGMQTAGGQGAITGKGANLFIIDDPFKNDEEANSETIREKVWGMYQSTAFTRLEPGGCVILIQTRWHEDDLAGRVLRDQADEWFHLDCPAIAVEDRHDLTGRAPGEALWPERYSVDDLETIRLAVGSYVWNSLYQQNPFIEGGGILKPGEIQRFAERDGVYMVGNGAKYVSKSKCWRFITIDTAGTAKNYSDYNVAAVFDVTPDREGLLVALERSKFESSEHLKWLRGLFDRYDPRFIGIENKSFGTTLIQNALRAGLRVQKLSADTDKVTRAYGASPFVETGRLQLPYASSWLAEFEHEMSAFPYGTHDDQVDAFSYGAVVLNQYTRPDARPPKAEPTREERVARKLRKREKGKAKHPMLGTW